ncbi:hypothetical protein D9M68_415030 [compost metagenome]
MRAVGSQCAASIVQWPGGGRRQVAFRLCRAAGVVELAAAGKCQPALAVDAALAVEQVFRGGNVRPALSGHRAEGVVQQTSIGLQCAIGLDHPTGIGKRALARHSENAGTGVLELAAAVGNGVAGDGQVVAIGGNRALTVVQRASCAHGGVSGTVLVDRAATVEQVTCGRHGQVLALDAAAGVIQRVGAQAHRAAGHGALAVAGRSGHCRC